MDQNDLVSIQQSAKRIRNPFGFDFTVKWAGKPITLSGDGDWYSVIAPLADHIARRLYMKIRYQYHDEQVAAIRAKGDDRGARSYAVPADVENKIMMLITGEPLHKSLPVSDPDRDEADLTVLKREINALEKKVHKDGAGISVTKLLEKATIEALPLADKVSGKGTSGHVSGGANLNENALPSKPLDTTPVNVADLGTNPGILPADPGNQDAEIKDPEPAQEQSAAPKTNETAAPKGDEFGELRELDHDGQQTAQ